MPKAHSWHCPVVTGLNSDPGAARDSPGAVRAARAAPPDSSRNNCHGAIRADHARSSPHRAELFAPENGHPQQIVPAPIAMTSKTPAIVRFITILPFVEYPGSLSPLYPGTAFCNANTRAGAELRGLHGKAAGGNALGESVMRRGIKRGEVTLSSGDF